MNNPIENLFTTALGLQPPWHIAKVELNTAKRWIDFEVEHTGKRAGCPACGAAHELIHDRVRQSWRHLDFFSSKPGCMPRYRACNARVAANLCMSKLEHLPKNPLMAAIPRQECS